MKVEQVKKFEPIVITLDTTNDAEELIKALANGFQTCSTTGENIGMKLAAQIREML